MKKVIRVAGLMFAFTACFLIVTALIRVRQQYMGEIERPVLGGLVHHEDDPAEGDPAARELAAHEVDENAAVEVGRALFHNPSPLSAETISTLLNRLEERQKEQDQRQAALDQRESELNTMFEDVERNRTHLTELAEQVQLSADSVKRTVVQNQDAPVDEANLKAVANLLVKMDPTKAAEVLQAKSPEQSAAILLKITDERKAKAILEGFSQEKLAAVTDALLSQKQKAADSE